VHQEGYWVRSGNAGRRGAERAPAARHAGGDCVCVPRRAGESCPARSGCVAGAGPPASGGLQEVRREWPWTFVARAGEGGRWASRSPALTFARSRVRSRTPRSMPTYTAVVERCADTGLYVGYVPGFPGAHTQAETLDELDRNLAEVVELLPEDGVRG
jgi:predicted RNase H-like HicB family nuclease